MTRYGIQLTRTGEYWCGSNLWAKDPIAARWFRSMTEAERAALRELPDRREDWTVVAIQSEDA